MMSIRAEDQVLVSSYSKDIHCIFIISLKEMYAPIATFLFGLALASPLNAKRAGKTPVFFLAGDSTTATITSGGGGINSTSFSCPKRKLIIFKRLGRWIPLHSHKWSHWHKLRS